MGGKRFSKRAVDELVARAVHDERIRFTSPLTDAQLAARHCEQQLSVVWAMVYVLAGLPVGASPDLDSQARRQQG